MRNLKKILAIVLSLAMAIGVFSVIPASALTVDTANNYKNITFVDESQEVSSQTTIPFADKKANLIAYSNYEGTELELNGITNAYLSEKYGSRASAVANYYFEPYKGKDTAYDTPVGGSLNATDAGYLTDKDPTAAKPPIYEGSTNGTSWGSRNLVDGVDGTSYERWWYNTHENSTEGILYGKERVDAGYYDFDMTVTLNGTTHIDSIYLASHPNLTLSLVTYGIFVANSKAELYNDENLVAFYDYSGTAGTGNAYAFNNPGSGRLSETQVYDFAGEKPFGRYVGVRVYDMSHYAPNNADAQFSFYGLDVYGESELSFVDFQKETNTTTGLTFTQKLDLLNTKVKYKGTTLELYGLNNDYLSSNYVKEDNKLYNKTAEIDFYNDKKTTTNLSPATDFSMYQNGLNPSNSSIFSGSTLTETGYDANTTGTLLYGMDRINAGGYDMDITVNLGGVTELTDFYMFGHYNPKTAIVSYGVFVSNDKATLYNDENRIVLFDYTAGASGETYKLNSYSPKHAEGQVWEFTGSQKPVGRYLGIRLYNASENSAGFVSVYELGAYGDSFLTATDAALIESVSTSKLTAVVGEAPGATVAVTDAEGKPADRLNNGSAYTFTATESTDPGYSFLGWYNGATLLSEDRSYAIESYAGEVLTAKYETNAILDIDANENVTMKSNWPSFSAYSYVYDAEEDAMALTNTTGKALTGGSLITELSLDGKNALSVQYEPWTTYKYSIVAKLVEEKAGTLQFGLGAHSLLLQKDSAALAMRSNTDYKEFSVYFNSGAANWRGSANNATSMVCGNMFNYGLPSGATMYIKKFAIEKVNNVKVSAENAAVELTDNSYLHADFNGNAAAQDSQDYEGNVKIADVSNWIIGKMNAEGFYGAAKTGETISFKVTPDEGYAVESVTVGGIEATEDNGVYSATVPAGTAYSGIPQIVSDYVEIEVKTKQVHVCAFDKEVAEEKYLATEATCTAAATYYKSCSCGVASTTETFSFGEVNSDAHTGMEITDVPPVLATCIAKGMTESTKWSCCNAPIKVATETEINKDNHAEGCVEISDGKGYAATCTSIGKEDGLVYSLCGAVSKEGAEIPVDSKNHTGEEVETSAAVTATCKTEGKTQGTAWSCCNVPIKVAENIGLDANNHEGDIVASEDNKPATATEPGLEGKTVYSCCPEVVVNAGTVIPALGHKVAFFDKNGTKVYEAQIQNGENAAAAAEEALKVIGAVVGYQFKGWDNNVEEPVVGETNFTATYERDIETKYQTSINGEPVQEVAFDTKITVKAGKKSLWKINGEKYHIGETVVAYSFGAMDIVAEEIPAGVNEEDAFVSLLEVKTTSGEIVAFVHVYAGNKTVTEYGANFWNVLNGNNKNVVVTAGTDAMITLYGIKAGAQRGVKAYALVDGKAIYSEKTAEYTF